MNRINNNKSSCKEAVKQQPQKKSALPKGIVPSKLPTTQSNSQQSSLITNQSCNSSKLQSISNSSIASSNSNNDSKIMK